MSLPPLADLIKLFVTENLPAVKPQERRSTSPTLPFLCFLVAFEPFFCCLAGVAERHVKQAQHRYKEREHCNQHTQNNRHRNDRGRVFHNSVVRLIPLVIIEEKQNEPSDHGHSIQHRVDNECDEKAVVALPDAVVQEGTVVVEHFYAVVARLAVVRSLGTKHQASRALLEMRTVLQYRGSEAFRHRFI